MHERIDNLTREMSKRVGRAEVVKVLLGMALASIGFAKFDKPASAHSCRCKKTYSGSGRCIGERCCSEENGHVYCTRNLQCTRNVC